MSIVLGTTLRADGAPLADVAALLAAKLATPLRLVHVSEDARAPAVLGTPEEHLLGPVRAALDAEAARLRALGATVQPHLAAGGVVHALVSVGGLDLATAVVVGAGSPALLGTTAERAARSSAVPVVAVREPARLLAWLRGERPLRVLVGADGGEASRAARAFAQALGAAGPCAVEVVHVAAPEDVAPRLEMGLERALARSAPDGEQATVRVLRARGSADAHLVAHADHVDVDLVVVGQRRQSLLEQLWHGSVAGGVLRASPVSVACVPPAPGLQAAAPGPPRVVVVGADFTAAGDAALAHAVAGAAPGATIHVAHALPTAALPDEARAARERAQDALARLPLPASTGVTFERHVVEGEAADALLSLARRVGADLVVLGARNRSALDVIDRALLGSVARAVSERAELPVLLVPAPRP